MSPISSSLGTTNMDPMSWQPFDDPRRRRRLVVGAVFGSVVMTGSAVLVLASAGGAIAIEPEEEPTLVSLEERPPESQDDPEPAPEPVSGDAVQSPGPRLAALRVPTEIPRERPREIETEAAPAGGGTADPYAGANGHSRVVGNDPVAVPTALEKPAPTPPRPGPKRPRAATLTEGMTPPKPLSQPMPTYPEDLKARGVEGVVVIRYKIDEVGSVAGAKLVDGPPGFWPVVAAAVKQWRFTPALDAEGRPVSVTRTHRFRFGLDTG